MTKKKYDLIDKIPGFIYSLVIKYLRLNVFNNYLHQIKLYQL